MMDDEERRMRRAAVTRATQQPHEPEPEPETEPGTEPRDADTAEPDEPDEDDAAAQRLEQQTLWVDLQVRKAMARGDFDDLPGAGKPLRLPEQHDPDWWVKGLIEREKLTGVAPPAIGLRRDDAELEAALDREPSEDAVRRIVEDFNRRVVEARRQLQGGPPVVTRTRDVDAEVDAWRARRRKRVERQRTLARQQPAVRRTRWWHRRR
jgi:hypothetical protein